MPDTTEPWQDTTTAWTGIAMTEPTPPSRGLVIGIAASAVLFAVQAAFPAMTEWAHLYPVAVLAALWSDGRWAAPVLGITAGAAAAATTTLVGIGPVILSAPLGVIALTTLIVWLHAWARKGSDGDLLRRVFDELPAGLVVYDRDDRMVECNGANKALYPAVAELMKPGVTFEAMVRATAERDLYATGSAVEDFVQARIERHRDPGPPRAQMLSDGRRLFIHEKRLPDGATVVLRTDVSVLADDNLTEDKKDHA